MRGLDLSEGKSTGIPTIQEELHNNGSPKARFFMDDDRQAVTVKIPIHPDFINKKVDIDPKKVDIDPKKVDIDPQKVDIQALKINFIKRQTFGAYKVFLLELEKEFLFNIGESQFKKSK